METGAVVEKYAALRPNQIQSHVLAPASCLFGLLMLGGVADIAGIHLELSAASRAIGAALLLLSWVLLHDAGKKRVEYDRIMAEASKDVEATDCESKLLAKLQVNPLRRVDMIASDKTAALSLKRFSWAEKDDQGYYHITDKGRPRASDETLL